MKHLAGVLEEAVLFLHDVADHLEMNVERQNKGLASSQ